MNIQQKWQLASRRATACFADRLLVGSIYLALQAIYWIPGIESIDILRTGAWHWSPTTHSLLALGVLFLFGLPKIDSIVLLAIWVVYPVTRHGRTFGMCMRGRELVLVKPDGSRPGFWSVLLWHFASYLSAACAGLGYIWMFIDGRGRTWHDIIAGVMVVRGEDVRAPGM